MKAWLKAGLTIAIGVVIGLSAHATSLNGGCKKLEQRKFNGGWWLKASPQERENFLSGLGDCLIWSAHVKWIRPFDSESDQVTEYYKTHPEAVKLSVITAWRRVMAIATERKFPKNAEVWTNPHSFYDGEYWRESGELESRGFL